MMDTVVLLFSVVVFLIIYLLVKSVRKPFNFPPGPPWYPLVGSSATLKRYVKRESGAQYLALQSLCRKYTTNVLGLRLGTDFVVATNDYATCRAVFKDPAFEARPDNFFVRLRCLGRISGITCTEGKVWVEQRSFVLRHLRDVGFGRKPMELKISEELNSLLNELKKTPDVSDVTSLFAPCIMNVLWMFTAGVNLRGDPRLGKLLALLLRRTLAFDVAGGLLNQFPWLRFIAPDAIGYTLLCNINKEVKAFLQETIKEHFSTIENNENDDLIYSYIKEIQSQLNNNSNYTEEQLIMICLDLFIAGSQTTSSILGFIFQIMLLYPEIQKRVQKEIDTVVPNDRLPQLSDRVNLPYVEAVLTEVERMRPPAAVVGPRRALYDTTLSGYYIPKGTTVLVNIWSVHMDPDHWGDPEVFRPERFLTQDGTFISDDYIMLFGLGRRRCPGESLARSFTFLFFTGIIQRFSITANEQPSNVPLPGITISPKSFEATFCQRI